MHQELIAIKVPVQHADSLETIVDMLIAPSYVVRAFAEFLADREDEDTFIMKGKQVNFQDCSVSVGDSKKVVSAYECLKRYDMPLSNHNFFGELMKQASVSNWKLDQNYRLFEKWYVNRTKENEENEDDVE